MKSYAIFKIGGLDTYHIDQLFSGYPFNPFESMLATHKHMASIDTVVFSGNNSCFPIKPSYADGKYKFFLYSTDVHYISKSKLHKDLHHRRKYSGWVFSIDVDPSVIGQLNNESVEYLRTLDHRLYIFETPTISSFYRPYFKLIKIHDHKKQFAQS